MKAPCLRHTVSGHGDQKPCKGKKNEPDDKDECKLAPLPYLLVLIISQAFCFSTASTSWTTSVMIVTPMLHG
jgi:hypothetical protein